MSLAPILASVPYTKRAAPPSYDPSWFNTEHANVQRAIPSTAIRTAVASETPKITDSVVLYDATAAAISVTLPLAGQVKGWVLTCKKIDSSAHVVTIVGTVDGVVNPTLPTQYKSLTLVSDGITYYKLAAV